MHSPHTSATVAVLRYSAADAVSRSHDKARLCVAETSHRIRLVAMATVAESGELLRQIRR